MKILDCLEEDGSGVIEVKGDLPVLHGLKTCIENRTNALKVILMEVRCLVVYFAVDKVYNLLDQ